MADNVQQIKDKLSIVEVVSAYVKLERAGITLKARCPFHAERTPSFNVSSERGTYHCFGCGVGGDIFTFTQAIEGVDFKGALKILADKAGVELTFGQDSQKDGRDQMLEAMELATHFYVSKIDTVAQEYLATRGINERTLKDFRIGFAGNDWTSLTDYLKSKKVTESIMLEAGLAKKNERGGLTDKFRNRIMFPICDNAGRVVAFSGRTFGIHASPEAPKYLNSPETPLYHKSHILYGFDKAKVDMRKHNCAILVEGQMDLVSSHQAGWANTVAVSGTAFTTEHAQLIKRMTDNLVLALDADPAGIKAAGRAARVALSSGLSVKVAQLPSGMDPADLILREGKEAWATSIRESKDIITFLVDVLESHTPLPDRFRKMVETVVLPFLNDVQSPIAREQYLAFIAQRLNVSVRAVQDAYLQIPKDALSIAKQSDTAIPIVIQKERDTRTKQVYSIILWQQSLSKPSIDTNHFLQELTRVSGEDEVIKLQSLSESDKESLRFTAGDLYGIRTNIETEIKHLTTIIDRARLAMCLSKATFDLKIAEDNHQHAEIADLMAQIKDLTDSIAKLHK